MTRSRSIRFSNSASQLGPEPVAATPENVQRASPTSIRLQGEGGTMMIEGIKAALDFPHDRRRLRFVSFLTDGYIGNEAEILGEIHQRLGDARIFSFGVGSSVNRYLLDRMAKLGKGAVAYIGLERQQRRGRGPLLRPHQPPGPDRRADRLGRHGGLGGLSAAAPRPVRRPADHPDRPLRRARPTRRSASPAGLGGSEKEIRIPVEFDRSAPTHPGLACVWARKRIEDLATRTAYDMNPDLPGEIKQVALQYGLMSAYTAFVAVDSTRTTPAITA